MKVAILGGGFCGATLAKELDNEKDIQVTLIDKHSYFEYNPSAHKCLTNPGYQRHIQVPFSHFLHHTEIVTEPIKKLFPSEVHTRSKRIGFDYGVLCLGCSYPIFLENKKNVFTLTRSDDAKELFKALKDAKKVLIVGGGYIGTEIAGELATKRSDLQITMVHSHDRILERNTNFASKSALKFLKKRGVNFVFNDLVIDHPEDYKFKTKKGKTINADVCIWCAGVRADTSFLEGFSDSTVDKSGRIRVNESLQLVDYPHFFAGGDLTDIKEEKTARKAELHAKVIALNLRRMNQGKSLIPYTSGRSPMVISLGDNHGIGQYGKLVVPGLLSGIGKWLIEWWTLRQFY
ncbi:MAG TPA: FAD-dependent oxidoreductase [Candidatus Thermoplasmatota archaeon]|nr:FAD-dependent oxidoreductase [Candidatus Thermoplasmatota archaeon]